MKTVTRWASACILAIVLGFVSTALAEEVAEGAGEEVSISVNADVFNMFMWRGQVITKNGVFQPSVDVELFEALNLSAWGNMDLTKYNGQAGEVSEIDYAAEHFGSLPSILGIEGLNYSLGAIHYTLHGNKSPHITELFWGLGFDCPLNPSMKVYHDTDKMSRAYLEFTIGHSVEKIVEISGMPVGMDVGARLGWGSENYNDYYWGNRQSSLNDLGVSVAFPVELAENLTLTPSVSYVTLVDSDIRKSDAYTTRSDFVVAGLSLNMSF